MLPLVIVYRFDFQVPVCFSLLLDLGGIRNSLSFVFKTFVECRVRSEYWIPNREEAAVVADVNCVVEVMILGGAGERDQAVRWPRELVAAVTVKSLSKADCIPGQHRKEVHICPEQGNASWSWKHVSQNELDRMSIFSCDTDSRIVWVVHFVDVGVDKLLVEEPMGPVEYEVLDEHEEADRGCEGQWIWQVFNCHRGLLKKLVIVQDHVNDRYQHIAIEKQN